MLVSISNKADGFTLFEVILVLILISIFATIAVIRQPSTDVSLKAGGSVLRAHIRYAQMRAMNTDEVWGIVFSGANYGLFRGTAANRFILPGETQDPVNLGDDGISIASIAPPVSQLGFDTWGRPMDQNGLLLTAPVTLTLSKGNQQETLTVTPDTGFIP